MGALRGRPKFPGLLAVVVVSDEPRSVEVPVDDGDDEESIWWV